MAAAAKHRECLVATAIGLFRRQGYAGTGLAEILEKSGAPRGSLYHYFPQGKVEIAEVALRFAGEYTAHVMRKMAGSSRSPSEMIRRYGERMADALERSGFLDGCPVATVVLEAAPTSEKLTVAGQEAFAAWSGVVERMLVAAGMAKARAVELADFTIGAMEGALILARARQSTAPVLRAADELSRLFEAEFSKTKGRV